MGSCLLLHLCSRELSRCLHIGIEHVRMDAGCGGVNGYPMSLPCIVPSQIERPQAVHSRLQRFDSITEYRWRLSCALQHVSSASFQTTARRVTAGKFFSETDSSQQFSKERSRDWSSPREDVGSRLHSAWNSTVTFSLSLPQQSRGCVDESECESVEYTPHLPQQYIVHRAC